MRPNGLKAARLSRNRTTSPRRSRMLSPIKHVLLSGFDPAQISGYDPAPILAAFKESDAQFEAAGVAYTWCTFGYGDEAAVAKIEAALVGRRYDCIVIGGGVRLREVTAFAITGFSRPPPRTGQMRVRWRRRPTRWNVSPARAAIRRWLRRRGRRRSRPVTLATTRTPTPRIANVDAWSGPACCDRCSPWTFYAVRAPANEKSPPRSLAIKSPDALRRYLEHLGEPADPPPTSPARAPPQTEFGFGAPADPDPQTAAPSQDAMDVMPDWDAHIAD